MRRKGPACPGLFVLGYESKAFALRRLTFFAAAKKVSKESGFPPDTAHSPDQSPGDFSKGRPCPFEKRRTSCAAPSGSASGTTGRRCVTGKDEAKDKTRGLMPPASLGSLLWLVTRLQIKAASAGPRRGSAHGCALFSAEPWMASLKILQETRLAS